MGPLDFAFGIILIMTIAVLFLARLRHDRAKRPDGETERLQEQVEALRDRLAVVERITIEKENSLEREIERLRDKQERLVEIGDRILIDGMKGTIVALISDGKYSAEHPAEQWSYLGQGMMVDTDEAGLVHYPTLEDAKIEKLPD